MIIPAWFVFATDEDGVLTEGDELSRGSSLADLVNWLNATA
jgi:hypothetical protein